MDHAAFALLATLAAAAQALFGFGYAVLLVPVAALFIDPETAVVAAIITSSIVSVALYWEHQPRDPIRGVGWLAAASVLGVPIGLLILTRADADLLRLGIGVAVLVSAALGVVHGNVGRPRREEHYPLMLGVGLLSGLLRGSVSMPGPPVLLYQHWRGGSADAVRSTMFAFNAAIAVPGVALAVLSGVVSTTSLEFVAVAVPGLAVGVLGGRLSRPYLTDRRFARASFALLAVAAILGLISAVAAAG